jgi:two-component system, NtrC family, nitrogen regulation sensor histidine kinase NtrY
MDPAVGAGATGEPPRGGHPLLAVEVRRIDADVSIVVADNGCGIPVAHIDRLFEPDFTLRAGGTGLGLAVVRQAIAAHGGSVTAGARRGGGAEFRVLLPLQSPAEPE